MKRKLLAALPALAGLVTLVALVGGGPALGNAPVTGAAFTTVNETIDGAGHCTNGNPNVNCNIYDGKEFVWLNGGPGVAYVGDGQYFFAVLDPGGQADPNDDAAKNLSDDFDLHTNRTFSVSGGTVSYGGLHDFDSNKIRLADYADTSNPGGVYILAICSLADGYPVNASDCKYDAFKIQEGEVTPGNPLTVTKDADGAYKNKYAWTITKDADKTIVKQIGGNAIFTYTITVTPDGGTISDIKVTGTISVSDPNVDSNEDTVAVGGVDVADQLSDGTGCSVTNGTSQTLTSFDTHFAYSCTLSSLPQAELDNTVTATWPEQLLENGSLLAAGSADFTFSNISFAEDTIDECVSVSDSYKGWLGSPCVGDANPKSFTYSRTIAVPTNDCQSYDNTATFTPTDTGATGSASKTVTVCGPAKTGALTMGFWQNKNGQKIITTYCNGSPSLTDYLRGFNPFQDLATGSCSPDANYILNVIKAATAKGAAMNAMLKAQMLATALDVYFSDPTLGGNRIGATGPLGSVAIDLTLICKMIDSSTGTATCSGIFYNTSSAFGGATCPNTTVSSLLSSAASQSNVGGSVWYGQVKATQEKAKNTFDAINNQVAFKC
jgi:hypothetical protein